MSNFVAVKRSHGEHFEYKHINWYITKRCNYDCSYCSDLIHDKTSERPSLEKMKLGANNIFAHISPKQCFFDFTGGEPTIIPDFDKFIQWLREEKKIKRVGFITNGTRKFDYYDKIMQYNDHITFSYHFEYADDEKLTDRIFQLHKKYNKKIRVQIMYHAKHFERLKNIVKMLQDDSVYFSIREIREKAASPNFDPNALNYTEEMLQWMKDNEPKQTAKALGRGLTESREEEGIPSGNYMSHTKQNRFEGWHCWVGIDYFQIWFDGTVNRGGCGVGKPLGNIYTSVTWPLEPVVCTKEACFCGPEIFTRKTKDLKYSDWLDVP